MKIARYFTDPAGSPYDGIEFRRTSSEIRNPDGSAVFRQDDIEVPAAFSQVACDVLAQKYFRKAGVPVALRRLVLAGIAAALAVAILLGVFRPDIDAPTAAKIADRLRAQYDSGSGEPARNFAPREDRRWADGWEFRWRYRPCPEAASLRVWISRDGRRASYAELPDCAPERGLTRAPLKV